MIKSRPRHKPTGESSFLDGQLLVAMPGMPDPRFARAVIYMCAHSADGAMGIVINKRARRVTISELLAQLKLVEASRGASLPSRVVAMRVLEGGPVEEQRGFVLHSPDYHADDATLAVDDDVSLTASIDVLKAIVEGEGPDRAILALGYAGWGAGQLESEILNNGWLVCPADPDLLFDDDLKGKYGRALGKLGINPAMLASEAGHG